MLLCFSLNFYLGLNQNTMILQNKNTHTQTNENNVYSLPEDEQKDDLQLFMDLFK